LQGRRGHCDEDNTGVASLIDFGDLRKFGVHASVFGTRRTYAPEVANLGHVNELTDIYALSATFLYLLLGHSHREFEKGDQADSFEVLPFLNDEKLQFSEEYCEFIEILFKLVNPNPSERPGYLKIKELVAKRREKLPTAPNPNLEKLINPTVTQIRSLITSSKDASSGAILELLLRDPEYKTFYEKTFLKTSLERDLLPEIIAGKRKVLLLTGNPGGGKTSTIKCIANEMQRHIINIKLHKHVTRTQMENLFFNDIRGKMPLLRVKLAALPQNKLTNKYGIKV
jgi:serine/threonine protein kinase